MEEPALPPASGAVVRVGALPPGSQLVVGRFDALGAHLQPDLSFPLRGRRRPAERGSARPFPPGSAAAAAAAVAAEVDRPLELAPSASGRAPTFVGAREDLQNAYGAQPRAAGGQRRRLSDNLIIAAARAVLYYNPIPRHSQSL